MRVFCRNFVIKCKYSKVWTALLFKLFYATNFRNVILNHAKVYTFFTFFLILKAVLL